MTLTLKETEPKQHFTQPAPHFTEASLVKALEELGIGRPEYLRAHHHHPACTGDM